ncbi:zinc finger protein 569-like isoform X3 [Mya arenaria]|uniref:zinc finger protein 569-like isoform X3 n=1 Tax=Mya arenaria TaxID=6604 RepID=UPI0022E297B1|nr:zinc finger protein 569-like isoform X3 [Mya arenaria]
MGSYLMMLYVTVDQEMALKSYFTDQGWPFKKPDLSVTTEEIGGMVKSNIDTIPSVTLLRAVRPSDRKRKAGGTVTLSAAPVVKHAKLISSPLSKTTLVKQEIVDNDADNDGDNDDDYTGEMDTDLDDHSYLGSAVSKSASQTTESEKADSSSAVTVRVNLDGTEAVDEIIQPEPPVMRPLRKKTRRARKSTTKKQDSDDAEDTGDENDEGDKEGDTDKKTRRFKLKNFKGPLACDICGQRCTVRSTLNRHRLRHFPQARRFSCVDCDKKFFEKKDLVDHMKTHILKQEKCSYCGKIVRDIDVHAKNCTKFLATQSILKCRGCSELFDNEELLLEHHKTCEIPAYQCDYCGAKFTTVHSLTTHLKRHNPEDLKFECTECPEVFKHEKKFKEHAFTHKPLGKCKYCGQFVPGGFHAIQDCPIKSSKNPVYVCPHCSLRITGSKSHVVRHIARKHGQEAAAEFEGQREERRQKKGSLQSCTECGYFFKGDELALQKHMENYHGEQNSTTVVKCDKCGENITLAEFPKHLETHANQSSRVIYECDSCGNRFETKEEVEHHAATCLLDTPEDEKETVCLLVSAEEDQREEMDPGTMGEIAQSVGTFFINYNT